VPPEENQPEDRRSSDQHGSSRRQDPGAAHVPDSILLGSTAVQRPTAPARYSE
jgi:hypothetical protein